MERSLQNIMTKQNLRHDLRHQRNAMVSLTVEEKSELAFYRLSHLPEYQSASCIACYVSIKNEMDTQAFIQKALGEGKQVGVPVTKPGGIMNFQTIAELGDLQPVHFGLLEPSADSKKVILPETFDWVIVPGIAFDRCGHRVGSGGGYYDRFMAQTEAVWIGLAYAFQIVDQVPVEPHDLAMDVIVTEDEVIRCLRNSRGAGGQGGRGDCHCL